MKGMADPNGDWTIKAITVELFCPTCGKTVYIDKEESEQGCPVCSSPLGSPPMAFIDLRGAEPAIVLA